MTLSSMTFNLHSNEDKKKTAYFEFRGEKTPLPLSMDDIATDHGFYANDIKKGETITLVTSHPLDDKKTTVRLTGFAPGSAIAAFRDTQLTQWLQAQAAAAPEPKRLPPVSEPPSRQASAQPSAAAPAIAPQHAKTKVITTHEVLWMPVRDQTGQLFLIDGTDKEAAYRTRITENFHAFASRGVGRDPIKDAGGNALVAHRINGKDILLHKADDILKSRIMAALKAKGIGMDAIPTFEEDGSLAPKRGQTMPVFTNTEFSKTKSPASYKGASASHDASTEASDHTSKPGTFTMASHAISHHSSPDGAACEPESLRSVSLKERWTQYRNALAHRVLSTTRRFDANRDGQLNQNELNMLWNNHTEKTALISDMQQLIRSFNYQDTSAIVQEFKENPDLARTFNVESRKAEATAVASQLAYYAKRYGVDLNLASASDTTAPHPQTALQHSKDRTPS